MTRHVGSKESSVARSVARMAGSTRSARAALWAMLSTGALVVTSTFALAGSQPPLSDFPLAAQATIAGALAKGDGAFAGRASRAGAVVLRNAQHDLTAEVTARGVTMSHADVQWRLDLRRWGRGGDLQAVPGGQVATKQNRVDVTRKDLVEWYVNGALGIEQGFTLAAAPSATDGQPVVLELASSGSATLAMAADGATLEVLGSDGAARLRYAGLTALDADGRALPVVMKVESSVLRIQVDDRGARYPVVVDPLVQSAKFLPSKITDFLEYGHAVAVSGDTMVVLVSNEEPLHGSDHEGTLHVLVRTGATWSNVTEVAVIHSPSGGMDSVAIDGDTIVVGTTQTRPGGIFGFGGGAALVFVRPSGGWADVPPIAILTASDGDPLLLGNQFFGNAVAIDGDTIVVGAYFFNPNATGGVYVYEKPPGGWATATETAKLTAAVPINDERLGSSVAISGSVIVAGAPAYPSSTGSALLYERPIGGWVSMTETAAIGASDGQVGDGFGSGLAVDGDVIAVGAFGRDIGMTEDVGGVYVFEKPISGWASETETALLLPTSVVESRMGYSVAMAGSRIVAGAPILRVGFTYAFSGGGVYVFDKPVGGWAPVAETELLVASDPDRGGTFGGTVAIGGDGTVAVGSPGYSDDPYHVVGRGYAFEEVADVVQCSATRIMGCAPAGKGQLALKYNTEKRGGSQLKWKFAGGPELHRPDFGDPLTVTGYALCVYDDDVLKIAKPLFAGSGRWALSGADAYAYANKDKSYAIGGLRKVQLKGGVAGKSAIQIQGKGPDLGAMPWAVVSNVMLNATTAVVVQLQQGGGGCYETSFLPGDVSKNSYEFLDGTEYGFKGTFQAGN